LRWAIENKWLCPVHCLRVEIGYDLSGVHVRNGDYAPGELEEAMDGTADAIAEAYRDYARGATLIFAVSVAQCEEIAKRIPGAVAVTGETRDRASIIEAFTRREIPCIVNCMVFTEGTDMPLVETVITIGSLIHSGNYIVRDGSTIGELIDFANIELQPGDTVVRGGPLRGESLDKMDRSITKGASGLFIVESGTIPPMEGHSPCVACGSCSAICPARLRPDMLSRYAEFGLHDRCYDEYITSCLECGLCGYVCIARRPVLQYIRLAKEKLGLKLLKTAGVIAERVRQGE
jgi:ferredoxin